MNDIKQITNAKKYIESFDRFFISFSAVKNASLADFLVQYLLSLNLPPRSIIFNRQTYSNLEKSGLLVKFTPLKDKGILVDKVFGTDYASAVKGLYEKQKRYKILLFTLDEAEGREFEKLDMIDNRINDIDAVGFDNNGNFFQYLYKLPKEDVVFKVKANKPAEALKVVFFKTEVNGSLTPLYPKTDPRVVAKKSGDTFSYAIDKNELFESDKVLFILKISGKELVSDYNDFYFGDKQAWYLNVNPDRIFAHNNKQDFDEEIKTEVTQKPADIDVDTSVPDSEKFNYYGDIKNPKQISLPTDTPIKSVINLTDYQKIEGTKLKSDRGVTITVGKYIAKGGEGFVYFSSQPGMVIKLFNDGLRTRNKKEKIEFMTKKRITHPCIAWPQDSLYDSGGNFVGYQMMAVKTAKGMGDFEKMCKNQVFMNSVKKTSLAAAAASISSTMEYLHQRNVVLGDIKLENFAIKEDDYLKGDFSHIIFVDCDSYQLDKFPCTVFSEGYVSPESKVELFSKFYRPIQYDQFSLYVLLFKLFFRRVLPYTRIRKESEPEETRDEAARSGIFPYYLSDDGSTEKIA
ncbi:MAG: hypothetical protein K5925_00850, partial [Bacilli bacterium]|nr:hypothetical protein [Bacilli bacterium]